MQFQNELIALDQYLPVSRCCWSFLPSFSWYFNIFFYTVCVAYATVPSGSQDATAGLLLNRTAFRAVDTPLNTQAFGTEHRRINYHVKLFIFIYTKVACNYLRVSLNTQTPRREDVPSAHFLFKLFISSSRWPTKGPDMGLACFFFSDSTVFSNKSNRSLLVLGWFNLLL